MSNKVEVEFRRGEEEINVRDVSCYIKHSIDEMLDVSIEIIMLASDRGFSHWLTEGQESILDREFEQIDGDLGQIQHRAALEAEDYLKGQFDLVS